jgi:hypothetical protein
MNIKDPNENNFLEVDASYKLYDDSGKKYTEDDIRKIFETYPTEDLEIYDEKV